MYLLELFNLKGLSLNLTSFVHMLNFVFIGGVASFILVTLEYFITYIHLYICLSIVCYLVPTFSRGRPITPQVVFVSTRVRFLSL